MDISQTDQLFSNYHIDECFYDEMFNRDGSPREHCRLLYETLIDLSSADIASMQNRAEQSFLHEGITFAVYGEEGAQERIIPIDFLPRILTAKDWNFISGGLRQRLKALNLFLADIYGPKEILADGVMPVDLVLGCPQYRPEMLKCEGWSLRMGLTYQFAVQILSELRMTAHSTQHGFGRQLARAFNRSVIYRVLHARTAWRNRQAVKTYVPELAQR